MIRAYTLSLRGVPASIKNIEQVGKFDRYIEALEAGNDQTALELMPIIDGCMLNVPADTGDTRRTPLMIALASGAGAPVLHSMLEARADPSLMDGELRQTPIQMAARRGNVDFLSDVRQHGWTVTSLDLVRAYFATFFCSR